MHRACDAAACPSYTRALIRFTYFSRNKLIGIRKSLIHGLHSWWAHKGGAVSALVVSIKHGCVYSYGDKYLARPTFWRLFLSPYKRVQYLIFFLSTLFQLYSLIPRHLTVWLCSALPPWWRNSSLRASLGLSLAGLSLLTSSSSFVIRSR